MKRWIACALLSSLAAAGARAPVSLDAAGAGALRAALMRLPAAEAPPAVLRRGLAAQRALLEAFYAHRDYTLLWSDGGAASAEASAVIGALQAAADEGLQPRDYAPDELALQLRTLRQSPAAPLAWADFDRRLSASALAFIADLHDGRIDPRTAHFELPPHTGRFDALAQLQQLATEPDTRTVLERLEPQFIHYRLLEQALPRFRELARQPALSRLPPLPHARLAAGERYAGAAQLRTLLAALGCAPPESAGIAAPADPQVLDAPVVEALTCLQSLYGLRVDGVLGRATYAALTTPLAQRVRQIELTLERWRWLPPLRAPSIIVNIPQFRLFALTSTQDHESSMLRMNVIVGRQYPHTRTPVFTADMRYVVFRPYWDVPRSILTREILPLLQRNPDYLRSQDMEIVRGASDQAAVVPLSAESIEALAAGQLRLRQRPGPENALGLIKFVLPNPYDVYLHSTPATRLFDQPRRTFSHGCIRVSDPVALAEQVLAGNAGDWTASRIIAAMNGDATLHVPLAVPVHVLIVYGTAVATEDGAVHFFDDIYGYDRQLESLLGLPPLRAGG